MINCGRIDCGRKSYPIIHLPGQDENGATITTALLKCVLYAALWHAAPSGITCVHVPRSRGAHSEAPSSQMCTLTLLVASNTPVLASPAVHTHDGIASMNACRFDFLKLPIAAAYECWLLPHPLP